MQGNCRGAPNSLPPDDEPLAPLTATQCVIIGTATVFSMLPESHRLWLDSVYLRLEPPPGGVRARGGGPLPVPTGVVMQGAATAPGHGVSLWMTHVTVQGGRDGASRGLLVSHAEASVHVDGATRLD